MKRANVRRLSEIVAERRLYALPDIYYACQILAMLIGPSTGPPLVEIEGEGDHGPPGAAPSRTTYAAWASNGEKRRSKPRIESDGGD